MIEHPFIDNWLIKKRVIFTELCTFYFMARQHLVGQGLLIVGTSPSHSVKRTYSVGILWTSDQPEAQAVT